MRLTFVLPVITGAILLASCSDDSGDYAAEDIATADMEAGPDIDPVAAPGVAMSFAYDYRLDDDAIAGVQEVHAAACEELGLSRCRIAGFDYRITPDEEVVADLQIHVDPRIARAFGKDATAAVEQAKGELARMQFDGEDMSTLIEDGQRGARAARDEIATIEAQLANAQNLSEEEAAQLRRRLAELRDRARGTETQVADAEARLAVTPMNFSYYGDVGVPGFGGEDPVEQAWEAFVGSFVMLVRFVLLTLATLLPWALLVGLLVLIWRSPPMRGARRWWRANTLSRAERAAREPDA